MKWTEIRKRFDNDSPLENVCVHEGSSWLGLALGGFDLKILLAELETSVGFERGKQNFIKSLLDAY